MANTFTTDILIQTPDPNSAASFYVDQLGFKITGQSPRLLCFLKSGCAIIKDEPDVPRCYVKDPFGLIYNLAS